MINLKIELFYIYICMHKNFEILFIFIKFVHLHLTYINVNRNILNVKILY